jgi:hypothetical protein
MLDTKTLIENLIAAGARACEHCDAEAELVETEHQFNVLEIRHDDDCPVLARRGSSIDHVHVFAAQEWSAEMKRTSPAEDWACIIAWDEPQSKWKSHKAADDLVAFISDGSDELPHGNTGWRVWIAACGRSCRLEEIVHSTTEEWGEPYWTGPN